MDYIIGDVQGCYDTLQKLLKKINFSEDRDRLFFLGDVVNRGNKSLETLRFICSLKENAFSFSEQIKRRVSRDLLPRLTTSPKKNNRSLSSLKLIFLRSF